MPMNSIEKERASRIASLTSLANIEKSLHKDIRALEDSLIEQAQTNWGVRRSTAKDYVRVVLARIKQQETLQSLQNLKIARL